MKPWKIAAAAWLAVFMVSGSAHASERFTPKHRHAFCRYATLIGGSAYTDAETRRLIDCATDHFPVPGGDSTAFYYANRESGYECHARNPLSSAAGVYQMVAGTWASWASHSLPYLNAHGWRLRRRVLGCRPNVMVAIREVHMTGSWTPWGG